MKDRGRILLLSVATVPALWYVAVQGHGDAVTTAASSTASRASSTASSPASSTASSPAASSNPPSAASTLTAGAPAPAAAAPAAPAPTPSGTGATAGTAPAGPAPDPEVVERGTGTFTVVPGSTRASGSGPVRTYTVSVEGGLGVDPVDFAAQVDRTLADPRSWGAGGRSAFRRVDAGPSDVQVVLASPATTDRLCRPLSTAGIYSCGNGSKAVLNSMRWLRGADAYTGRLAEYRQYVVNHEVGHTLGHGHQACPAAGSPAPVMMQQTKGVGACLPSPWPFP